MRKPVPWTEPTRLTVEVPKTRNRKPTNPADAGNGIGAEAARSKPCRSAASPVRKQTPTVTPKKATASKQLLALLGHSESCADLRRAGRVASCDCRVKPMEDPAITVGLAIHFARISLAQLTPPACHHRTSGPAGRGRRAGLRDGRRMAGNLRAPSPETFAQFGAEVWVMDTRLADHLLRRLRHHAEADAIDHAVERNPCRGPADRRRAEGADIYAGTKRRGQVGDRNLARAPAWRQCRLQARQSRGRRIRHCAGGSSTGYCRP